MARIACLIFILFSLACNTDLPEKFPYKSYKGPDLGYSVTFPGKSSGARHSESTPFGQIEWFSRSCMTAGRLDQIYLVDVGTLPPGDAGGANYEQIMETLRNWIRSRYPGEISQLDSDRGPGFEYFTKGTSTSMTTMRGIFVFRNGRLHHARATGSAANSRQVKAFLASFRVDP